MTTIGRAGAGISLLLLIFLSAFTRPVLAQEPGNSRAGLVIVGAGGQVITRCVAFAEPEITGLELLRRSGISFIPSVGPTGAAICSIAGEGCPAADCFCACKANPCRYWMYAHAAQDGAWVYSGMGAAGSTVRNGDVDAWMWSDGSAMPPAVSFTSICETGAVNDAAATVAAAPSPTPLPAAAFTPTASPTKTPAPTPSPARTIQATAASLSPSATSTPSPAASPTGTVTSTGVASPQPAATVQEPDLATEDSTPDKPRVNLAQYGVFAGLLVVLGGLFWYQRARR